MLKCVDWCEDNQIPYGVLTGFSPDNTIRNEALMHSGIIILPAGHMVW